MPARAKIIASLNNNRMCYCFITVTFATLSKNTPKSTSALNCTNNLSTLQCVKPLNTQLKVWLCAMPHGRYFYATLFVIFRLAFFPHPHIVDILASAFLHYPQNICTPVCYYRPWLQWYSSTYPGFKELKEFSLMATLHTQNWFMWPYCVQMPFKNETEYTDNSENIGLMCSKKTEIRK